MSWLDPQNLPIKHRSPHVRYSPGCLRNENRCLFDPFLLQGSFYYQPKQCTFKGILNIYHTFALFDPSKLGNLMTPVLPHQIQLKQNRGTECQKKTGPNPKEPPFIRPCIGLITPFTPPKSNIDSGQSIIFHQPRFAWNKGISLWLATGSVYCWLNKALFLGGGTLGGGRSTSWG